MRNGTRIASVIRRTVLLGALWAGLVGGAPDGVALGLLVVPASVALSLRLMPPGRGVRPGRLVALLPGFHLRSLLGGVDVARRALAPVIPLAPGWLSLPVTLSPAGRVALGAGLSLMPGTLAAGSEGTRLLVHVLDRGSDHGRAIRSEEARIAAVLDTGGPCGTTSGALPEGGGAEEGGPVGHVRHIPGPGASETAP